MSDQGKQQRSYIKSQYHRQQQKQYFDQYWNTSEFSNKIQTPQGSEQQNSNNFNSKQTQETSQQDCFQSDFLPGDDSYELDISIPKKSTSLRNIIFKKNSSMVNEIQGSSFYIDNPQNFIQYDSVDFIALEKQNKINESENMISRVEDQPIAIKNSHKNYSRSSFAQDSLNVIQKENQLLVLGASDQNYSEINDSNDLLSESVDQESFFLTKNFNITQVDESLALKGFFHPFKIIVIVVQGVIRLNNLKKTKKPYLEVLILQKQIQRMNPNEIQKSFQEWFMNSTKKYRSYSKCMENFDQEVSNKSRKSDIYVTQFLNSVKFLFEGLEIMTQHIPQDIVHLSILQLYDDIGAEHCLFVSKRARLKTPYGKEMDPIHKVLLISEYLILFNLIPFLMNLEDSLNKKHIKLLISVVQIIFYKYFNNIQLLQITHFKHQIVQIEISDDQHNKFTTIVHKMNYQDLQDDLDYQKINQIDQDSVKLQSSELLYSSLFDLEELGYIFNRSNSWLDKIFLIFDKILRNLIQIK